MMKWLPPATEQPAKWKRLALFRELHQIRQRIDATLDVYNEHGRPAALHPLLAELGQQLTEAKQRADPIINREVNIDGAER
jgi:hypothetical protein